MPRFHPLPAAGFALLLAGIFSVHAQVPTRTTDVLPPTEVTESNLVSALTPPEASASGSSHRTRGLRPAITKGAHQTNAAARPSASLLITFETDSATLTPAALQQLDVVAGALNKDALKAFTFAIEGHADPRGRHDANLTLSERRAAAVRKYLVDSRGVSEARLTATGKGDAEPMNRDNLSAPENRRVTIVTIVP